MIVFYCFVSVVVFMVLIDGYIRIGEWQSRIHIGRVSDPTAYTNLVVSRSKIWLKNTPTVKLTDNNRLVVLDMLKGNYKRNTIQHWQKAGLILGLHAHKAISNSEIEALLERESSMIIPKETDYVILAYALLSACNEAQLVQYTSYFNKAFEMLNSLTTDDGISYKSYTEPYKYVDTIGFVCPFLQLYALKYNCKEASEKAFTQIQLYMEKGMFPNTSLPAHVYNSTTGKHAGLFGWGRGMGWFAIGLIDFWLLLSKDDERYIEVTHWVKQYAEEILKYQQSDGSWSWSVLVNGSRKDSSTTVMLSWFLKNAAQEDSLSIACNTAVEKAVVYLKLVTRRNGALDFCQGDTKSIGVYAQTFDVLPFAQGYLLRILAN